MQTTTDSVGRVCETVVVRRIVAESPACKAGLRDGDLIRSVDGAALGAVNTLAALIMAKKPGAVVTLELLRAGKRMHVKVTLGARELPSFKFKPIERTVTKIESVDTRG